MQLLHLHVAKFSMCMKSCREVNSQVTCQSLPARCFVVRNSIKHIQVNAGFFLRPPRFLDAPLHPSKKSKARKNSDGRKKKEKLPRKTEKGHEHITPRPCCRQGEAHSVSPPTLPCRPDRSGPAVPPDGHSFNLPIHAYVRGGIRPAAAPTCRSMRSS